MLADELTALRRDRARRAFAPHELPVDAAAAYAVAAASLSQQGGRAGAWKLGATTPGTRRTFATDTIYFGALVPGELWSQGQDAHSPPPVFRAEAEIAFRLAIDIAAGDGGRTGRDFPPDAIFDAWTPALEAPYSCIENIPEAGLTALLSDRCAAGALFLGHPRDDIRARAIDGELSITVDGASIAAARASDAMVMTPIDAALGFLEQAGLHGIPLRRGQWISTGGVTPCVDIPTDGRTIALTLGGQRILTLDLVLGEPGTMP